ncbi:MAG: 3-deoxy-D-manno-octulosonic acid transferase [Roseinatronobacter sp.]
MTEAPQAHAQAQAQAPRPARRVRGVEPVLIALAALPRSFVWLHCSAARDALAMRALAEACAQEMPGQGVLLSFASERVAADTLATAEMPDTVTVLVLTDGLALARVALAQGKAPAAVLIAAEHLPSALILRLVQHRVPVFVLHSEGPNVSSIWRHLPGFQRRLLSQISHVFLQSRTARDKWLAQGLDPSALTVCGRLSTLPATLGCNEAEREALAEALRLRAVWLAVGLPEREEAAILSAHRETLRESHRLALILHPANRDRGVALKAQLEGQFITALRSVDDPVTPETQVYIVDTEAERGLWYRLAVACYLGGTLSGEGASVNPLEPAGLGCAIVHGRVYGRHSATFDLLRGARATRMIQSADALGPAISTALRPERAADQAHRAWQVIAQGAEASAAILAALRRACTEAPS